MNSILLHERELSKAAQSSPIPIRTRHPPSKVFPPAVVPVRMGLLDSGTFPIYSRLV